MNSTKPSSSPSLGFRRRKCCFGPVDRKRKTLVSEWSSVCVSTFIGRGLSAGDLFTAHSEVGEEGQGEVKGKDPPNCFKAGSE